MIQPNIFLSVDMPREPIKIRLPDGKEKDGVSF